MKTAVYKTYMGIPKDRIMEEHGNTGNKNAAKSVKKDTYIHIRVNADIKAKAARDAANRGLSLSEWISVIIKAQD